MHSRLIEKIDVFSVCSKIEVNFIVNNLHTLAYLPNDIVVRQGEEGEELFFINKGTVNVSLTLNEFNKQFKADKSVPGEIKRSQESIDVSSAAKKEEEPILTKVINVKDLTDGSYFGEVALVTKLKRTTTVTSTDFCTLSIMKKSIF